MKKGNEPAFPEQVGFSFKTGEAEQTEVKSVPGLTKREYFAAKIIVSFCNDIPEAAARKAVCITDALLKELEK